MFWFLLMVAGNDSTRATFCSGLKSLLEDPEQLELVRSGAVSTEQAVEEFLRYHPAFAYMRRTATKDTEIAGQPVAEGDKVLLWYVSGNRDETVFEDPHRFDVRRDPNPHQALRRRRPALLPGRRPRPPGDEAVARGDAAPLPGPAPRRRRRRGWPRPSSTSTGRSRSRRAEPAGPPRSRSRPATLSPHEPVGRGGRRRGAGMLRGDPHAQDAGPDPEAQRRIEHRPPRRRCPPAPALGVDLERRRAPTRATAAAAAEPAPRPRRCRRRS